MRTLGLALVMAGLAVATGAQAQGVQNFGWGSSARGAGGGGNASQQPGSGLSDVKKGEEKRFPLGAAWIAISLNGKAYSGAERPAFRLDDQFRVHGFGGCNSFSTTAYPLRQQGIAIGPLALTKRACDKGLMATEMAFLTALRTSAKWDTQTGSLIIKGPNGELRFERSL